MSPLLSGWFPSPKNRGVATDATEDTVLAAFPLAFALDL
jgi:hypothetical protein